MIINRHNYEEFFLLYVDNELTPAQRRLVDAFVAVNPDLKEEFRLINETKFNFDGVLDDEFKASLLKPVGEETIISEEQLLLYIDDELKADERMMIEEAAAKDYSLQKELQLLRRTVYQADETIVFPDKSLLYKEAQPARVFSIGTAAKRWSAAAAVFLLMGSAIWFAVNNQKPADGPVVNKPATPATEEKKSTTVDQALPKETIVEQPLVQQSTAQPVAPATNTSNKASVPAATKQNNPALAKNTLVNNQQQTPVIEQQKEEETIAVAQPNTTVSENILPKNSNLSIPSSVQSIASTTSSTMIDNDNNDAAETDERFLNEDRQRKSGLKSFAKKAKRLIERTTGIKSDDSEVRFAVFAVNTQ
jgi:anti-sigma factor RsiW